MSLPDTCIRGIINDDDNYFTVEGVIRDSAFRFEEKGRPDGKWEQSINWNDDENALSLL